MSKLNPLYWYGDVNYSHKLHIQKMSDLWFPFVKYNAFHERLKKMSLKDAIYTPSDTKKSRYNMKPKPIRNRWFRFISFFK